MTRAGAVCLVAGLLVLTACSRKGSSTASGGNGNTATTVAGGADNSVSSASFGTINTACGPNKTGQTLTASDRGVTASEIKVTTISDPGYTGRPGLNQELFDASKVFTDWCNGLGGINGRKIVDNQRDAAIFNYKQKVLEACQGDFSMVGGGGVFDDTGQSARLNCLMPDVPGYVVSEQARGADLMVQALPNALDNLNVGTNRLLAAKFPDTVDHVAYLTANVPSTVAIKVQYEQANSQLGWKAVDDEQYNALGEASWTPFAQTLKTKGAQGLVFVGEPANLAKLEQAMQSIGYYPKWIMVTANFYDKQLLQLGGAAIKNTYVQLINVPFYDADKSPAITKYLDLFKHYLPKGKSQALLGADSFSAWLLFAQAAKECGVDLTRKCMYNHARSVTSWNGGGLTAPADPSRSLAPTCFTTTLATASGFEPVDVKPNKGIFNCSPDNRIVLKGDYNKGTTLASVGKSLADLK